MKIRLKQQTTSKSGLFHFLTLTLGFLFRVMTDCEYVIYKEKRQRRRKSKTTQIKPQV